MSPSRQYPAEARLLASQLGAGAILAGMTFAVQKFLFPLEDYWAFLCLALLGFVLAQWLLIRAGRIANPIGALDRGNMRIVDTLPLLAAPVALSAALTAMGRGPFVFLYAALSLICILQTCLAAVLEQASGFARLGSAILSGDRARAWVASVGFSALIFGVSFFSSGLRQPVHPLLEGDPTTRGIWLTIPVAKSDLFPLGYARLEDSIFDDLGRVFAAGLGQSLGLVQACAVPGPDLTHAVVPPAAGASTQPRFNYAVDSMCPNWIASLPGFFWRIGLVGLLALALVVGIAGFRDPVDLAILSVILLFGWATWPAPTRERMGNVAVLMAGLPLIALISPLVRRASYSFLILWGLVGGVLFGLAAFVRRPCGLALLLAALVVLIYLGIRRRRLWLPLAAALALLAGNSLVPATLNSLLVYRDAHLQISAPRISPLVHGSGFPLLGGVGGRPAGNEADPRPQYPNSLDVAFLDAPIWYVVYDTNPMIGFAQGSFTLMQQTSQHILLRYVAAHPLQYLGNTLRKSGDALVLILNVPTNWLATSMLLFGLLALRFRLAGDNATDRRASGEPVLEMLGALVVLMLLAGVPAILTSPENGESAQLPAAILLYTLIIAVQYASRILAFRSGPK